MEVVINVIISGKPSAQYNLGKQMAYCFLADNSVLTLAIQVDHYKKRAYELQKSGAVLNANFYAGIAAGLQEIAMKGRLADESTIRAPYSADDRFWPTAAAMSAPYAKTCAWLRHHAGVGAMPVRG